jgi:toxin HigB-1
MILSFRHKGLKRFYEDGDRSGIRQDLLERVEGLLLILDEAKEVRDVSRPTLRLHPLKGDLKGYWAITVRANWRITFRFEGEDVFDIDLVDYH